MTTVDGGRLVGMALRREGVDHIFGICGAPVLEVFRGCVEEDIRAIGVRHEQAAAFMAQAWSFVTGKPGVAVAASGPAMINCVTGLANAWSNCWPLIVIGGSSPAKASHRGAFQEAPQVELAAPVCKWVGQVEDARRIPEYISIAVRMAMSGRPGPVYVDLPADVIVQEVELEKVRFLEAFRGQPRTYADDADVSRAADLLRNAERPLMIVGKGAVWSQPYDELKALADSGVPFVASPSGRGAIPDDHANNVGAARSYALRNTDLVLTVGARLNWMFHFGRSSRFSESAKLIQIDVEAEEIGTNREAEVGLVGDSKMILGQILEQLGPGKRERTSAWLETLRAEREKNEERLKPLVESDQVPMAPHRLLAEIASFVDRDAFVVDDGEACMAASRQVVPTFLPAHRLNSGTFGCMGVGVPSAIAVQLANPGKQVVSINGDSAFGFNGMEMETALRVGAPVVFVVANNDGIVGSELQNAFFPDGWEPVASYTPGIRYEKIMEAFGGHAEYVQTPAEIRPALERSFASGKAACINVVVDPQNGGGNSGMMRYG